jgi:hypothetical protein
MFEHKSEELLPRPAFIRRLANSFAVSFAIIFFSLALGTAGYHFFAGLEWLDSFLNASMILTGMGPVNPMESAGGKVFSALYALYSGIAFLTVMAVVLAPVMHRMLHRFHLQEEQDDAS